MQIANPQQKQQQQKPSTTTYSHPTNETKFTEHAQTCTKVTNGHMNRIGSFYTFCDQSQVDTFYLNRKSQAN